MKRIAPMIANLTAAYVLGVTLAPPLGGFLIELLGWRSVFMLATLIGLMLILMVKFYFPETHHSKKKTQGVSAIVAEVCRNYRSLLSSLQFTGYALAPGFLSGTFFALATSSAFLATDVAGRDCDPDREWWQRPDPEAQPPCRPDWRGRRPQAG